MSTHTSPEVDDLTIWWFFQSAARDALVELHGCTSWVRLPFKVADTQATIPGSIALWFWRQQLIVVQPMVAAYIVDIIRGRTAAWKQSDWNFAKSSFAYVEHELGHAQGPSSWEQFTMLAAMAERSPAARAWNEGCNELVATRNVNPFVTLTLTKLVTAVGSATDPGFRIDEQLIKRLLDTPYAGPWEPFREAVSTICEAAGWGLDATQILTLGGSLLHARHVAQAIARRAGLRHVSEVEADEIAQRLIAPLGVMWPEYMDAVRPYTEAAAREWEKRGEEAGRLGLNLANEKIQQIRANRQRSILDCLLKEADPRRAVALLMKRLTGNGAPEGVPVAAARDVRTPGEG